MKTAIKLRYISNKYLFFTGLMLLFAGCNSNPHSYTHESELVPVKRIPSVCTWDKISLRSEPHKKALINGTLSLGEALIFNGKKAIDSTFHNQVYLNVELSDGSLMWVPEMAVITDAIPGVAKEETIIYGKPDLLTVTDKKLSPMTIVAIKDKQDGFVNFITEKKTMTGWINANAVSNAKEDVAFALLANRKLNERSEISLLDKIKDILASNPYPNSIFIPLLLEIEKQEQEKKNIEEFMDLSLPDHN